MPSKKPLAVIVASFSVILGSLAITTPLFAASREKVTHSFRPNGKDGVYPNGVIIDKTGNLYGTTYVGGDVGTVFELTPDNGKWTETLLHTFHGKDGALPLGGLIQDAAGNLYGTTTAGGASSTCNDRAQPGCGTVFELSLVNGKWTEKVLHSFNQDGKDGSFPAASLILDRDGNLYGTTVEGGPLSVCYQSGCGVAFELLPGKNGEWTEKILYTFHFYSSGPYYALVMDKSGNLYGTDSITGKYLDGVVFELVPSNGKWTQKVLHTFKLDGKDGANPDSSLILDQQGNLYGATSNGGPLSGCNGQTCGTVFELSPGNNGKWTEKVLYSFNSKDGAFPGSITFDASGNLYGSAQGGYGNGFGTVFELTPNNGKWTEKVLHSFSGAPDGAYPGNVILDTAGHLYGATWMGGAYDYGAVFEIIP
jgi:uncharacterized repeat protein (TIGR03803 family)